MKGFMTAAESNKEEKKKKEREREENQLELHSFSANFFFGATSTWRGMFIFVKINLERE